MSLSLDTSNNIMMGIGASNSQFNIKPNVSTTFNFTHADYSLGIQRLGTHPLVAPNKVCIT